MLGERKQRQGWLSFALWEERQVSRQVREDCALSTASPQGVLSLRQRDTLRGGTVAATSPMLPGLGVWQALLPMAFEGGPGHLEALFRVGMNAWLLHRALGPSCPWKLDQGYHLRTDSLFLPFSSFSPPSSLSSSSLSPPSCTIYYF